MRVAKRWNELNQKERAMALVFGHQAGWSPCAVARRVLVDRKVREIRIIGGNEALDGSGEWHPYPLGARIEMLPGCGSADFDEGAAERVYDFVQLWHEDDYEPIDDPDISALGEPSAKPPAVPKPLSKALVFGAQRAIAEADAAFADD